jgi:hypothetical protein
LTRCAVARYTQGMSTLDLAPQIRLQKVGDFGRAGQDPEMKPPAEVTARFPPKAENFKCGPEGIWYATVDEPVVVQEGGEKVKRTGRRIHWLSGSGELCVAADLPTFHEIAFGPSFAILTADRGALLQLSYETRRVSPLKTEGYTFSEEARLWEVFHLEGERIVIREALGKSLVIVQVTEAGLVHRADFPFSGAITVVGRRFVVGGGKSVTALDLATNSPVELGTTAAVGVGMIWGVGANVRIYSRETGAWQILLR